MEGTIYVEMVKKAMLLGAAQIDLLCDYAPDREEEFLTRLHQSSCNAIIIEQTEKAIEGVYEVLRQFNQEIAKYRKEKPNKEDGKTIGGKLEEIKELTEKTGLASIF